MRRASQGFSLIELVVVLFILVIGFSALGINIAAGNQSSQMKAAVRDMVSALRYARGQALISRKQTVVAIDLAENQYTVSNRNKVFKLDKDMQVTMVIAQDELDENEIGKVRFYPDGSSSGGRITLEWDELAEEININWLSGQVSIKADEQQ